MTRSKSPKTGIIKLSHVKNTPGMRLDAGYYLGTKEETNYANARKTLAYAIRNYFRVSKRRLRIAARSAWWRITGVVKSG